MVRSLGRWRDQHQMALNLNTAKTANRSMNSKHHHQLVVRRGKAGRGRNWAERGWPKGRIGTG